MAPNSHIQTEFLCDDLTNIRPSNNGSDNMLCSQEYGLATQLSFYKGRGLLSGGYSPERNQGIPQGSVDDKSQGEQRSPDEMKSDSSLPSQCPTQEYVVPTNNEEDLSSMFLGELEQDEMFDCDSSIVEGQLVSENKAPETTKNLPESPVSVAVYDESQATYLSSSFKRPPKHKLYSAIGSLEQCSATSFGKMQSKYKHQSTRGFHHSQDTSFAMPPASSKRKPKPKGQLKQVLSESDLGAHRDQSKKIVTPVRSKDKLVNADAECSTISDNSEGQIEELIVSKDQSPEHCASNTTPVKPRGVSKKHKKVEMFRPSCDAYTPRIGGRGKETIKYKPAEMRTPVQSIGSNMGTLARPNFRDALKRVAMILRQHVVKIEQRFEDKVAGGTRDGLFRSSMRDAFSEDQFLSPKHKCTMVRLPMARPGIVYGLKRVKREYKIPTEEEIYKFGYQLFKSIHLSSECSVVCLIYVERLMEMARVPLLACTWRPIFMCGLLLASKVWQDLSSWNAEFSVVYPQFSLEAINKLELQFLKLVKWDLYISSSLYAKYYFTLRALLEKTDFRHRYNQMVGGVKASKASKVQQRTEKVKEQMLMQLSKSM